MKAALESRNVERVRSIRAYLEEVALSASADAGLAVLLRVATGEWLSGTRWETEVAP